MFHYQGQGFLHHSLFLGSRLCDLACGFNLFSGLDDSDGNGLLHVTDSKTSQWWVIGKGFHAHGFGWNHVDHSSISRFDKFGVVFQFFARTTVTFLFDFLELAGNVSGVAIQHRRISVLDLSRVVQNNDLGMVNELLLTVKIDIQNKCCTAYYTCRDGASVLTKIRIISGGLFV